jgi:hypothetical protein
VTRGDEPSVAGNDFDGVTRGTGSLSTDGRPRCVSVQGGDRCCLDGGHRGLHSVPNGRWWNDRGADVPAVESTSEVQRQLAESLYARGFVDGVRGIQTVLQADDPNYERGHVDGVGAVTLARQLYRNKLATGEVKP